MTADTWIVIDPQGNRSVYLDEAHALSYAVRVHGIVQPRYPYEPNATGTPTGTTPNPTSSMATL